MLRQDSTRWSQVTHYFFEGCTYYQPYTSEIPTGELRLLDIVDLNTLQPVPPTYNGEKIRVHKKVRGGATSRCTGKRRPWPNSCVRPAVRSKGSWPVSWGADRAAR